MSSNRVIAIIVVALIHVAVAYALVTGLAYSAVNKVIQRVTTVDIVEPEEKPPEELPPPEIDTPPPPPIVAPPPPINIAVAPPPVQTVTTPPPPAPVIAIPAPVAAPAPPPPPPAPSQARGVRPKGQSGWASRIQSNYPSRALREGTEGRVGVRVTVNGEGRVESCEVSSSSGSSVLDEAACQGMQRYARFDPALNDAGSPVAASWSTTIVYQLN